jgi:glycosyltransferase involved in cell wall biosynthesis
MKFLFSVHLYPPTHNCGGEYYIHNMAKFLISQGHQCRALLHQAEQHKIRNMYNYEGVEIFPRTRNLEEFFIWADQVFTHLEYTPWTIQLCRVFHKPCYFIVHNTHLYTCANDASNPVNIIYNSEYARDLLQYPHDSIVLHPPVDYRRYDVGINPIDNPYITIISLNENKGGNIFWKIAEAMPDRQFLAVKGSYDEQIVQVFPNVRVIDNTPDILPVYEQTRILLMPSEYESWGMTATEAMCNGIPVICTPTPGLTENCGDAGMYVGNPPVVVDDKDKYYAKVTGRDDIDAWVKAIRKLDNKKNYLSRSKLCRERSRELDPTLEYERLLAFIRQNEHNKFLQRR